MSTTESNFQPVFKTAEEVARYLDQYANSGHKAAAAFVRAQAVALGKIEKEAAVDRAIEFDRRRYEEAESNRMFIQCGGLE